jgi:YesN/AraC family two-component response regulator
MKPENLSGISIIVVDDNFLVREGVKLMVADIGCVVAGEAANGGGCGALIQNIEA